MIKRIILTSLFFTQLIVSYCQSPSDLLEQYLNAHHSEKIYISHDKPYYFQGETIWCDVYLVDAINHQAYAAEPIVYVDWINPTGVIENTYFLKIKDGVASLDIATDSIAPAGNYTLRAYTLYQKNFDEAFLFQKEIAITNFYKNQEKDTTNNFDFEVQFFPEGGELVAGLKSRVAFKAQNEKGENIAVGGVIEDASGQVLTSIKTIHDGMGFFSLIPQKRKAYLAKMRHGGQNKIFNLPSSLSEGYSLSIDTRVAQKVKVGLTANTKQLLNGCELLGHVRGQVFYSQIFDKQANINLSINQLELPSGLLTFTLFDAKKRPVAERLIFNKNPQDQIEVDIQIEEETTNLRSLVTGSIGTYKGEEIKPSQLSMAVYSSDLIPDDLQGLNIENYLLLQSDLKGKIHNINQYFEKDDAKTRTLLDLLLMTHGWRRFDWQQVLNQASLDLAYPVETSFSFSGQIKKELKDKAVKANVFLNVLDEGNYNFANVTTGEDGLFYFDGFTFEDTTNLLIQANIFNERKQKKIKEGTLKRVGNKAVDIELFNLYELPFDNAYSLKSGGKKTEEVVKKYVEEMAKVMGEEIIDTSLWMIDLEEVTVKRRRLSYRQKRRNDVRKRYREIGLFHFSSTDKFFAEDMYKFTPKFVDIFDLIRTAVPQARISGGGGNRKLFMSAKALIAGQPQAAFAVNGRLVQSEELSLIPPEAVFVMDVVTGLRADAVYGVSAVINVLVKEDVELAKALSKAQDIGMQQIVHPGFYQAKTFYAPSYASGATERPEKDYRVTLYWNPDVTIIDDSVDFGFYTGDIEGNYLIWVEGITKDGNPFTSKQPFFVNEE